MDKKRVAIYGGCFDPPTIAHLWIAQQILEATKPNYELGIEERRFDMVMMMPNTSGLSSNKRDLTDANLRLMMCRYAVVDFNPAIAVSDYSIRYGLDYTFQVVNKLHEDYPDYEHTICVGDEWTVERFKNYDEMKDKCNFLKIHRSKSRLTTLNISGSVFTYRIGFDLSSTIIRDRVSRGLPITGLVLPSVENFIKEKGLYK